MERNQATERQVSFIRDLAQQVYDAEQRDVFLGFLEAAISRGALTKAAASETIDSLKARRTELAKARADARHNVMAAPAQPVEQAPEQAPAPVANGWGGLDLSGLESGYYAADDGGKLRFFRVRRVEEGDWAGWVFVEEQATDDLYKVGNQRPGGSYRGRYEHVLARVAAEPVEAMARYGQEIGSCGVCGRTLTDETSRAYGIGPVCREKLGIA